MRASKRSEDNAKILAADYARKAAEYNAEGIVDRSLLLSLLLLLLLLFLCAFMVFNYAFKSSFSFYFKSLDFIIIFSIFVLFY